MDTIDRPLRDLVTVMELQVSGMDSFQTAQLTARDALKTKDWLSLEKALRSLDFQAEGLRALEERRNFLWSDLQRRLLGREGRFYETVALVPEAHREPLAKLHQQLKSRAAALRGLSQGLAAYVQTAGAVIQAVVHELQPALKGRLYSRSGHLRGGEVQPLVLSTHF